MFTTFMIVVSFVAGAYTKPKFFKRTGDAYVSFTLPGGPHEIKLF